MSCYCIIHDGYKRRTLTSSTSLPSIHTCISIDQLLWPGSFKYTFTNQPCFSVFTVCLLLSSGFYVLNPAACGSVHQVSLSHYLAVEGTLTVSHVRCRASRPQPAGNAVKSLCTHTPTTYTMNGARSNHSQQKRIGGLNSSGWSGQVAITTPHTLLTFPWIRYSCSVWINRIKHITLPLWYRL